MLLFTIINFALLQPYYYDKRIHNLGNVGFPGKVHAEAALLSTKIIDRIRYNGRNIRKEIMNEYKNNTVLDFCCGIGISTTNNGVGIDTSSEMLSVAKKYKFNKNKKFYLANAENYKPDQEFDIVTCMFAFHEMPLDAHIKIVNNAFRIAKKEIVIVDIASNYKPKDIMLSGEPYLIDYMETIDNTLNCFEKIIYIEGHVNIWKYKKIYFD